MCSRYTHNTRSPSTCQPPRTIWTIGHSTQSQEDLVALLKSYGIATLVDVRSFPRSRRNPQSNREELERVLPAAGIRYVWLGKEIGGFRKGGYAAHMATAEFAAGIATLEGIASEAPTAVMCAEKLFFHCHRRFIAEALVRRGWRVIHIFDAQRSQPHQLRNPGLELRFDERPPA